MRSKLFAAGAVLAVSLGLAACGGNDEAEPAPAPTPAPAAISAFTPCATIRLRINTR